MFVPPFENCLVLAGPTGSGKSQLALELADKAGAEIISMDSMSLYRGMDIGTAKPTLEQRSLVPHHLIDVLEPSESASVAWWLEKAAKTVREIEARGKRALFVGGTPLYLKAMLHGLFAGPQGDPEIRRALEDRADREGNESLHRDLIVRDPVAAKKIHVNDRRRIIRALEVLELTGTPISEWQKEWNRPEASIPPEQACQAVWLDIPRDVLYRQINARVVAMFETGLVEEVRGLLCQPNPPSRQAMQGLGYKEVVEFLEGRRGREETVTNVQTRTRNFAKRQLTWYRSLKTISASTPELTRRFWGPTMPVQAVMEGESLPNR